MATYSVNNPYNMMSSSDYIASLYRNLLGREADPGGLAYHQQSLASGATMNDIIGHFLASPERQQRNQNPYQMVPLAQPQPFQPQPFQPGAAPVRQQVMSAISRRLGGVTTPASQSAQFQNPQAYNVFQPQVGQGPAAAPREAAAIQTMGPMTTNAYYSTPNASTKQILKSEARPRGWSRS